MSTSPPFSLGCRESRPHLSDNRKKSPQSRGFLAETGLEKVSLLNFTEKIKRLFSGSHAGSPVSSIQQGECTAITKRWFGETCLTSPAFEVVVLFSVVCRFTATQPAKVISKEIGQADSRCNCLFSTGIAQSAFRW